MVLRAKIEKIHKIQNRQIFIGDEKKKMLCRHRSILFYIKIISGFIILLICAQPLGN